MKAHVLVSNDDGVFAPGLRALADAFLADGWRVSVCAPDQERSAASHSLTINRPMVASRVQWPDAPEGAPLSVWKADGMPADCVKLALRELCEGTPELVVSGVNNGWNVGTDVHYSGTVGAAMEAAFEGLPAIAVSAKRPDAARYACAAQHAVLLARRLLSHPLPMPSVLNVNIPDCEPEAIHGLVEAPMTPMRYTDTYDRMPHTRGRTAYWLSGDIVEEGCLSGGDLDRLMQGYATLTALTWDWTLREACLHLLQD